MAEEVGIYICHCGSNIAGTVDVEQVARWAGRNIKDVAVSRDYGETWEPCAKGLPDEPVTSIVVDPKSPKDARVLYAVSFGKGVYRSFNGGRRWFKRSAGLPAGSWFHLKLHPDGTLFVNSVGLRKNGNYVEEAAGIWKSTDGGDTWKLAETGDFAKGME